MAGPTMYVDPACYWLAGYAVGDDASVFCPQPGAAPPKRRPTKQHYVIAGRELWLTEAELREALAALLFAPEDRKTRAKARKRLAGRVQPGQAVSASSPGPRFPGVDPLALLTYPAAPRFDRLWGERWVQRQADVAKALRELAYEAQDEEDIAMLLARL